MGLGQYSKATEHDMQEATIMMLKYNIEFI